jgi:hypothetical protein
MPPPVWIAAPFGGIVNHVSVRPRIGLAFSALVPQRLRISNLPIGYKSFMIWVGDFN